MGGWAGSCGKDSEPPSLIQEGQNRGLDQGRSGGGGRRLDWGKHRDCVADRALRWEREVKDDAEVLALSAWNDASAVCAPRAGQETS